MLLCMFNSIWYTARLSHGATSFSPDNLTCSENVAYDTASSTLKISSQAKVPCSKNIAYATVTVTMADSTSKTTTRHSAVYDEVTLTNF